MIRKIFITGIILVLVSLSLTVWGITSLSSTVSDINKDYQREVGVEYVHQGDTLKVLDYSLLEHTFTLSDGTQVHSSLVFNKRLKLDK